MLLARQGVEHLLVNACPDTSDLPKAHVLNQRPMEVLEEVGVAVAIAERGTPAEQMAATAYYAGVCRSGRGLRPSRGATRGLGRRRGG
ncbi:MAG: FAD-dependent monooxygenase [Solirubrobacteraceae bacterium]